ncbi:MAG: transketolase [Phycisphaerales bacterium]|jgi:transketolase|nr:transketolase [Phycisphaerales bacterium]MDP6693026.1 transketolase [Phycisphaerales bacterium]
MSFEAEIHARAIKLGGLSLEMCAESGSGHPTSALSIGHIVTILMYRTMRWLPNDPTNSTSDRLVLSEGHAVPALYAALADIGATVEWSGELVQLTPDHLSTLRVDDSPLDGHPNPEEGVRFFDAATGSLGQGLSVAAGVALAAKADDIDRKVYCIIGDGESREGQITEALDFIIDSSLVNILPIFNCNQYGQAGEVSKQQSPERITAKLEAFGFEVSCIDGHDPSEIKAAVDQFNISGRTQPMAIVAKTVKGWGVPSLQGANWHGKPVSGDQLQQALAELRETGLRLTSSLGTNTIAIQTPTKSLNRPVETPTPMNFREAMERWDMTSLLYAGKMATRRAYGIALRSLGHTHKNVWSLDADVSNSTFSNSFANDPELEDRFVECKIAEQNMYSVGAGLSAAGKIPFCSTFAKFITRGYDQIEMAINSGANLKVVGSHSGISLAADGPSQMSLPDVAWFRSFATMKDHHGNPGCFVLQPADAWAAYALTIKMAEHNGCCYLRTFRPDVEMIYNQNTNFELGGMEVLTQGRDLLIVTAGYMVHECNKALDELDRMGVDATLLDLYSIPFDEDRLLDIANENNGNILVVEDNYGASLGSAVADACTTSGDPFTVKQQFVRRIPKSARSPESILRMCGLHYTDIAQCAASLVGVVTT